eukprot:6104315-Prymnesium_polylepis.1
MADATGDDQETRPKTQNISNETELAVVTTSPSRCLGRRQPVQRDALRPSAPTAFMAWSGTIR